MAGFSDGIVSDLLSNLRLEPSNYLLNWRFDVLNDHNDPDNFGDGIIMPEEPDGIVVFMTRPDGGRNSLASQFTAPVSIDEPYIDLDTPFVPGASPVTQQFAAQVAPPYFPANYLSAITSTTTGYEPGVYGIAFTWIDIQPTPNTYLHTRLSPALYFTVGQSQHILATLPDSPPEGVDAIGLWLTAANGSVFRLQSIKKATLAGTDVELVGPYKRSGEGPSVSEKIYKPKAPLVSYAPGDDEGVVGAYRVATRRIDIRTGKESSLSDWSSWIELTEQDVANNIAIQVDPEGLTFSSNIGESYQYVLYVQRADPVTQEIEDYVYVNPDGAGGTTILEMDASLTSVQSGRDSGGRRPRLSGRTERHRRKRGRPKARTGSLRRKRSGSGSTALSGSSIGTTARSGSSGGSSSSSSVIESEEERIEDPTSPLESAVGIGKTLIAPGTYKVAIAFSVGEQQSMATEELTVSVTSGQTIRVWLPPTINNFYNSQWRAQTSSGSLPGWTLTGANGTASQGSFSIDAFTGDLNLNTLGLKNNFPTQSTPDFSQAMFINQADVWTFGSELSATVSAGSVEVYLAEYDQNNVILRTTIIKSTAVSVDADFSITMGPGFTDWHADTFYVILGVRFTGSSRSATAIVKELYAMPWERRIRRRVAPVPGSRTPYNTRPKTYVQWKKFAAKGVELPASRFRAPPGYALIESMTFESNALNTGWTLRQAGGTTGLTAQISTAAALKGTYGYQFQKTTTGWRWQWLEKQFNPSTRNSLAVHFQHKVTQLPTRDYVYLAAFKINPNDAGLSNMRCAIVLGDDGYLWLVPRNPAGDQDWYELARGIKTGDTLDIEMLGQALQSTTAQYRGAVGINGATRTFSGWKNKTSGGAGLAPTYIYLGPFHTLDSGTTYNFYYDNIQVTETGDLVTAALVAASTDPLTLPDRPTVPPVIKDTFSFEDGLIPPTANEGTVGTARSPTDATKTVAVQTGAAIEGTYGLRVQDTGSGGYAYLYQTVPNTTANGWRTKYRVDALPSTGTYRVMNIVNSSGTTMMAYDLTSTGQLQAIVATPAGEQSPVVVRTGVVAGSRLTLEITFSGALSSSAVANFWHHYGATDGAAETSYTQRQLYKQFAGLDWTTWSVDAFRVGATSKTDTAATINLRVDGILRTVGGEYFLDETDSSGRAIYQENYFLPPDSPLRDDLVVQNVRLAVRPGKQYTFAIRVRCDGVVDYAYPFELTAFDISGNEIRLGDVFDRVGGCIGTIPWADQYLEFTVPDNCFEVRINSRQMGTGEWTFQSPAFCPGVYADVVREVTYPASGTHRLILNTETEGELLWLQPDFDRPWLGTRAIGTVPEGTTLTAEIAPRADKIPPAEEDWKDPATLSMLERKKYAHYLISMTSNAARDTSPELAAGTPYVDFFSRLAGEPVPTLLRGDFSEFYGGAYVQDINWPKPQHSEYDVKKPQGRAIRHKLTEPVGRFNGGFTIVAFTQRAMEEIEKSFLDEEFGLEYLGQRFLIKFTDPGGTEFTVDAVTRRWVGEEWFARGEAPSGDEVEIVSEDNLPGNWRNA